MLQCKAICCGDRTKCWWQEQAYVYGKIPWEVNQQDVCYAVVPGSKWPGQFDRPGLPTYMLLNWHLYTTRALFFLSSKCRPGCKCTCWQMPCWKEIVALSNFWNFISSVVLPVFRVTFCRAPERVNWELLCVLGMPVAGELDCVS